MYNTCSFSRGEHSINSHDDVVWQTCLGSVCANVNDPPAIRGQQIADCYSQWAGYPRHSEAAS